jgi:hypothetical protein
VKNKAKNILVRCLSKRIMTKEARKVSEQNEKDKKNQVDAKEKGETFFEKDAKNGQLEPNQLRSTGPLSTSRRPYHGQCQYLCYISIKYELGRAFASFVSALLSC